MTHPTARRTVPSSLIIVLFLGLFSAGNANAHDPNHRPPEFKPMSRDFGPHRLFKLLHRLELSDEQRIALEAIVSEYRPVMGQFMSDLMSGGNALHSIVLTQEYDAREIEKLAVRQAENAQKIFLSTATTFAEISEILSAVQRQELGEIIGGSHRRWGRKHHPRGNPEST